MGDDLGGDPLGARANAQKRLLSADALRAADRIADAIAELECALEAESALEPRLAAEIRVRLADLHREQNRHDRSYEAVGPVLDNPPDPIWRARAIVRLARALYFRGDPEGALVACEEATSVLAPTSHHADFALACLWLGHARKLLGQHAQDAFLDALGASRRAGASKLEAAALNSLGHAKMSEGSLHLAEALFEKSAAINEDLGHRSGLAKSLLHQAICLQKLGLPFEDVLSEAEGLYELLDDKRGVGLAVLLRAKTASVDEAVSLLDELSELVGPAEYARLKHQASEQRGFYALQAGDPESAELHFRSVLETHESVGRDVIADAKRGLAAVHHRTGRLDDARRLAEEAMEETTDSVARCEAQLLLAQLDGDVDIARAALAKAQEYGAHHVIQQAHRAVAGLTSGDERRGHLRELSTEAPGQLVAASRELRRIVERIPDLVLQDGPIVIEGETSVGKRTLARAVAAATHQPETTLDVEAPGVLLVSNLERLPEAMLEKVGERIGKNFIIGTTEAPLRDLVRDGRLSPALYNGLAKTTLVIPPLRNRPEDVKALAEYWAGYPLDRQATSLLMQYDWPGNHQELQNVIHDTHFHNHGEPIRADDLPEHLRQHAPRPTLPEGIRELEERFIRQALRDNDNNRTATAEQLGISRKGLIDRLKRLGLWDKD